MTAYIPIIGGKDHLSRSIPLASRQQIMLIGAQKYNLQTIQAFNSLPFYVHESIVDQPEFAVLSYLQVACNYDPGVTSRYANWFKRTAINRVTPESWIYLDAPAFFTDLPDDLTLHDFRIRLSEFLFKGKSLQFIAVLGAMKYHFPGAFFLPTISLSPKARKHELKMIRPLVKEAFGTIQGLLQPKNVKESELLTLALAFYCNSSSYLYAIVRNKPRIDLHGQERYKPTQNERGHAARLLRSRGFNMPDHVYKEFKLAPPVNKNINTATTTEIDNDIS